MGEEKSPWNPSVKAIARVKNVIPAPIKCHICGGNSIAIVHHEKIYGRAYSEWPWCYRCDNCGAYVGMHPFTNIPLGTLADVETREARKRCKPAFENLWRGNNAKMTRSQAYQWLADKLSIPVNECHFGWFSKDMCELAKQVCEEVKHG